MNVEEMKKKFPAKNPKTGSAATKAAKKRIHREYEMKKAELGLDGTGGPFRRGMGWYLVIILVMMVLAGGLIGVLTGKVSVGKKTISKADIQVHKSVDALAVACGRYKFHVGRYPTAAEGLEELARLRPGLKGWFGPYVKKIVDDPWGHAYVYDVTPDGKAILYSMGPDGKAGTPDDILPEPKLFDEPFTDTTWTNHWVPYQLRGILVAPNEPTRKAWQEEVKKY